MEKVCCVATSSGLEHGAPNLSIQDVRHCAKRRDGQRATGQRDYSLLSTDDMSHITMNNGYRSYLRGRGPHNLYFLKHTAKHESVSHAMQQLNSDHVLDGTSIPLAR